MLLGILLCAQQDIIGVLNGEVLCAQWKVLCAQLDIIGVLNEKLGAQWEVRYSTGNYNVLNWTLLRCSTGS